MDDLADNPAREEAPPSVGTLLVRGREEQGFTRNDVAQRLHMSPSQVEALESGDYSRLPRGPFLRGFVRNYAKLVGLDADAVLALLAEGAPRETAPRIVVPTQNIRFDPLGQRFSAPWVKAAISAGVVAALAFVGMYWWVYVRPAPPAQNPTRIESPAVTMNHGAAPATVPQDAAVAPPTPAPQAAPSQTVAPPNAPALQAPTTGPAAGASASTSPGAARPVDMKPGDAKPASAKPGDARSTDTKAVDTKAVDTKPVDPKPAATAPSAPDATKTAAAAPSQGRRRLHFRFKGESWVEVRDADDVVVYRQLNAAGTERNVSGKAPLTVVVGNAHEVEVEKDGKPFDLGPSTDTDVARFKVD